MACLLKPPQGDTKGCVTFTTPERDFMMHKDAKTLAAVESLKDRYFIGLHHNWHDFDFIYDPLFDFSMAGDADLIERGGRSFPRTEIDCCYFVPAPFFIPRMAAPFWDVINVSRDAFFKGHEEFYHAIRAIYDRGRKIRVLHLCPVARAAKGEDPVHNLRRLHESLFSLEERRLFPLMTMDWDHPFPLDLETLAQFYRSGRVFLHTAPDERRCRIAAYAWASGMPVVGRANVASILPSEFHRPPFYFGYDSAEALPQVLLTAIDCPQEGTGWNNLAEIFRPENAADRLSIFLDRLAASKGMTMSSLPINPSHLDFRLGRHHLPSVGKSPNMLPQTIAEFCNVLHLRTDGDLADLSRMEYPENALLEDEILNANAPRTTSWAATKAAIQKPSIAGRLRTLLRKGHSIPLTNYRVIIDVLRDS